MAGAVPLTALAHVCRSRLCAGYGAAPAHRFSHQTCPASLHGFLQREPVAVADHGNMALMEGLQRRAVADRDDGGCRQFLLQAGRYSAASEASSSEAVASSRNRYCGACNSARASPRRCCSPSESIRFQWASSSSREPSCGRPTSVERFPDPVRAERVRFRRDRRSPRAADPIGKYGRCGSIISDAPAGTAILPVPNGQMPAMARNKVDLPEPDGPVSSVRSPPRRLSPSAETSGVPLGSRTMSWRRSIALPPSDDNHADRVARGRQRRGARDRRLKPVETGDDGAPVRQRAVDRDEERQRLLHAAEGGCRLRHAAELDLVGEIGRRHQDVGKDHGGLRIARGERGQPLGPAHDAVPVFDHVVETLPTAAGARRSRPAAARSARRFPAPEPG